jgi:choline dehydrogenase-like flavoprotein
VKIAVVGSGAAAHAVLLELARLQPDALIHIYDAPAKSLPVAAPDTADDYDAVYAELKKQSGLKFPPPKVHFGRVVDSRPETLLSDNWQQPGGLTNYWGATCLPFLPSELKALGLSREQLEPYYQRIGASIGIAGDDTSPLAQHYNHGFMTAPAIRQLALFRKAEAAVNAGPEQGFIAGSNCLALDVGPTSNYSCTYCGHCLAGCYRQALFSSSSERSRQQWPNSLSFRQGLVRDIDLEKLQLRYIDQGQRKTSPGYDRIFLAAGCIQSSAIIMRSLGLDSPVQLYDNAVVQFPILYTGPLPEAEADYFALSQLLINCRNSGNQIQLYPFADHLLRSAVPEWSWPRLQPIATYLRRRLIIARLYLHSNQSHRYSLQRQQDEITMHKDREPKLYAARDDISALGRQLRSAGFRVLGALKVGTSTSSHFASSIATSAGIPAASGQLANGIYCCDGAMFPESPATSPTFTIMANAARIAEAAL